MYNSWILSVCGACWYTGKGNEISHIISGSRVILFYSRFVLTNVFIFKQRGITSSDTDAA